MPVGKVRFYDAEKGFGFLTKDEGGDVYVRANALPPGVTTLKAGQRVEFGVVEGRKGEQALSVHLVDPPPSLSKAHRKPPEQMTVIVEDLIKMLDGIGNGYRRGRHPDAKTVRQSRHGASSGGRRARAVVNAVVAHLLPSTASHRPVGNARARPFPARCIRCNARKARGTDVHVRFCGGGVGAAHDHCQNEAMASSTGTTKPDEVCLAAVDLARAAAEETAGVMGVGEYLGAQAEDTRVVSHLFACPHPGYRGWRWSVTVVRAARARVVTINEVVLLPGEGALQTKAWVPWAERIQPRDVTPGVLLPRSDDDSRLEPGYSGGEDAANPDSAEMSLIRSVVAELGLGRERVLSAEGRDEAAERWLAGRGRTGQPAQQTGT